MIVDVFAERLEEARAKKGRLDGEKLSGRKLEEELAKIGYKLSRSTIAKLENALRERLTVDEVFALAYVLGTTPADLLFPADEDEWVQVVGEVKARTDELRAWMGGQRPLSPQSREDWEAFFSQAPVSVLRHYLDALSATAIEYVQAHIDDVIAAGLDPEYIEERLLEFFGPSEDLAQYIAYVVYGDTDPEWWPMAGRRPMTINDPDAMAEFLPGSRHEDTANEQSDEQEED